MADSSEDGKKSQNSGASGRDNLPRLPDGNIDVDQLKIRILIIGKSRKTCDSIANYLVRRGWETTVNTNIKDAFQTVTVFKPDFVLISVNLPSPKIHQLPTVMAQTFKVPSIIFGEGSDTKTMGLMQNIQASYKMMGSVSGPSAHRRIKQILQEIYLPQDAKEEPAEQNTKEETSIVIKGNQSDQGQAGQLVSSGQSRKPAYMPGIQTPANQKGPGMFIAKGGSFGEGATSSGQDSSEITGADSAEDLEKLAALFQSPEDSKGMHVDDEDGVEPSAVGMTLEDILDHVTESVAEANGESTNQSQGGQKNSTVHTNSSSGVLGVNPKTADGRPKKEKKQYAIVEMFDVVTDIAEECALPELESQVKTGLIEESTIIPVDSTNHKGYLFIGAIGSFEEEMQFVSSFVQKLKTVLPREFTNIHIGEEQRIQFVALTAKEKIDGETKHLYLRNGAGEIYIKFIKESRFEAKIIDSSTTSKAEIDPKDLVPNTPVGVEIYMHLPKNEKFYQYLKPRSAISDKQKEKLISGAVKLYINKPAANAYREVLRKNKTLETIFDTSKRGKKAS